MPEVITFPSIEQFRTVVKIVRDRSAFSGQPIPKLKFTGTVKLHGTNIGVVFPPEGGPYAQSRNETLGEASSGMGFMSYVTTLDLTTLGHRLRSISKNTAQNIVVYGEWCGGNIQKNVGISGLEKMWVVFKIRVKFDEDESYWFTPDEIMEATAGIVKNIYEFPTWSIEIDFTRPEQVSNHLGELTAAVEAQCPVALAYGKEGIGEGIVWTACPTDAFYTRGLVFKVKGEKHSETKVKTLAPVDVEKFNSIRELAEGVCSTHRLQKKYDELAQAHGFLTTKNTGDFLKSVALDIIKEEKDTIEASGLEIKEVMAQVNRIARQWWLEVLSLELDPQEVAC